MTSPDPTPESKSGDGGWRCPRCHSNRWVHISINEGLTLRRQCVPCGHDTTDVDNVTPTPSSGGAKPGQIGHCGPTLEQAMDARLRGEVIGSYTRCPECQAAEDTFWAKHGASFIDANGNPPSSPVPGSGPCSGCRVGGPCDCCGSRPGDACETGCTCNPGPVPGSAERPDTGADGSAFDLRDWSLICPPHTTPSAADAMLAAALGAEVAIPVASVAEGAELHAARTAGDRESQHVAWLKTMPEWVDLAYALQARERLFAQPVTSLDRAKADAHVANMAVRLADALPRLADLGTSE